MIDNIIMIDNIDRRALILHPVRLRLLAELTGREMTTGELADALPDVPQASLYRHIRLLADNAVFEVASERPVRGVVERTFRVAPGQSRLSSRELRGMTAKDHQQAFEIFLTSLTERLARYVRNADLEQAGDDGLSYTATAIYLDETEQKELKARIEQALAGFTELGPGPGRRRFTLASVVIPESAVAETREEETS